MTPKPQRFKTRDATIIFSSYIIPAKRLDTNIVKQSKQVKLL